MKTIEPVVKHTPIPERNDNEHIRKTVFLAPTNVLNYIFYYCNSCKAGILKYKGGEFLELPYEVSVPNGIEIKCRHCGMYYIFTWM